MPINTKLFDRIQKKLGVTPRHVHRLIERKAAQNSVPRGLAALLVGSENDIPIHRYATDEELAELRGVRSISAVPKAVPSVSSRPQSTKATKAPKATRNNSIFVVHGRDAKLTEDMYSFLRSIGLNPMEWNEAIKAAKGGANPNVGDVINQAMKKVQGVLVLLSPDEDAKLKGKFVSKKDKRNSLHVLRGGPTS